jgi:hypothetical protein
MVASHLIWLLRTRDMRRRARAFGQTFDTSDECVQWQAEGLDLLRMFTRLFSKHEHSANDRNSQTDGTESMVVPEHVVPKTVPIAAV